MIYLDNAATSWPKPETVYRAADQALRNAANPGRGGHQFSRDSARLVLQSRETVARFFGVRDSRQLIFTAGATDSLNMVIYGLVPKVKKILSIGYEHNALWRPLADVANTYAVIVKYINPGAGGRFDWAMYEEGLTFGPDLVAVTHASNVTGVIVPLAEVTQRAQRAGALVCVDVSQTAGVIDLNLESLNVDFAAFPGHKGLLGPQGVGGLYIRPGASLRPVRRGGTGSKSADPEPPEQLPDRFESGTVNVPGIAGLAAGVSFLEEQGMGAVLSHELKLRARAVAGLRALGATVYEGEEPTVGVLSFNFPGVDSAELAYILDDIFALCLRGGLHCSPRSHQAIGTIGPGTVRLSPGIFNAEADIDALLDALEQLQQMMR